MSSGKTKQPSSAYTAHNTVQLVRAGNAYFSRLLQLIASAKQSIDLQTYILESDETGQMVAQALIAAANRKVQVRVMADAYASSSLSKQFIAKLEEGGVVFRFFEPLFKTKHFYVGRRLHHKLVVADAERCLIGGINIGNRYNDMPEKNAWLDFALYVEGPVARQVCILAWKTWNGFPQKTGNMPCPVQPALTVSSTYAASSLVRMRRNDWVLGKKQISKTYKELFATATTRVTILCSYFMPGNKMKRYILTAVKKGVKVKVIMAGQSDVALAKNAERYMYGWLLRNNIEIYEYQENILHGKLAVCDGKWLTIGSYNINNISAYASVELNLDVKDEAFATQTEQILEYIITTSCIRITKEVEEKARNIFTQLARWCSYEFVRILFFLFTFYFRQNKNKVS